MLHLSACILHSYLAYSTNITVPSKLDPALLSEHAGHGSPGPGGEGVDVPS